MYVVTTIIKFNQKKIAQQYQDKMIHDFQDEIRKGFVEVYLSKE